MLCFLKAGAVSRTNKNLARIPVQQSSMMLYYNIYILLSSIFYLNINFGINYFSVVDINTVCKLSDVNS